MYRYITSILVCLSVLSTSCAWFNKNIARTVVDASLALCLAANALKSDATIKEICGYADDVAPIVKQLVGVHREQLKKATGV